jgi:hypothetical protein
MHRGRAGIVRKGRCAGKQRTHWRTRASKPISSSCALPNQTKTARKNARKGSSPPTASCFSSLQHRSAPVAAFFSLPHYLAACSPGLLIPRSRVRIPPGPSQRAWKSGLLAKARAPERSEYELARRGPIGLLGACVLRPLALCVRTPTAWRAVRDARRRSRAAGAPRAADSPPAVGSAAP